MATNPQAMMRFQATDQLPQVLSAKGPLVTLLRAISPRDLSRCTGVTIDERLGYSGSRMFRYGTQALQWIAPEGEQYHSWPAESWRKKRFDTTLYLEDFVACCASYPANMLSGYPRQTRPTRRATIKSVNEMADDGLQVLTGPVSPHQEHEFFLGGIALENTMARYAEKPEDADPQLIGNAPQG